MASDRHSAPEALVAGEAQPAPAGHARHAGSARTSSALAAAAVAAAVVLALALGLSAQPDLATTLTEALLLGALAVSFQLVYGLLGELSLGISGFFGAGAYAFGVLGVHGASPLVALLAAAAVGLVVGILVAGVTARLGGVYFAVATFALAALGAAIVSGTEGLGKTEGLIGVPGFANLGGLDRIQSQLLYAAITFGLLVAVIAVLRRTRLGLALATIRSDASLARSLGLNIPLLRVVITGLSGLLAGVVGAVFAQGARFVGPDAFGISYIIAPLAIVIIGGLGYSAAAIPGAIVVVVIPQLLDVGATANQIISAAILLLVIVAQPDGIIGGVAALRRRLRGARSEPGRVTLPTAAALPDAGAGSGAADRGDESAHALSAEGVTVRFGRFTAVDDVTVRVGAGEIVGLIGPNGAGKSTLVNAVSALVGTDAGRVAVRGADVTAMPAHLRARAGLGRTFQHSLVADSLTVRSNLRVAEGRGRVLRAQATREVDAVAAVCGLHEHLERPATSLSFMYRRLLSIAMALVSAPPVVMLDEATAGLSLPEREAVAEVVVAVARSRGTAFIVIEHDVDWVAGLSDRIVVMKEGRLLREGAPQEVLADPEVIASYLGTS